MLAMAGCAVFWLGTALVVVVKRQWINAAWMCAPLAFLGPHLFFAANTYYPRHIAIGYLSMAAVAACVWILAADRQPAPAPGSVG
jgi:hypothetical protein